MIGFKSHSVAAVEYDKTAAACTSATGVTARSRDCLALTASVPAHDTPPPFAVWVYRMRLWSPKASRWFAALSGTPFWGGGVKRSNPSDGHCFRQEFSGDSDVGPTVLLWKPLPLLKNLPYSQILQTPSPFETPSSLNEHGDFPVFLRADVLEHVTFASCTGKCTRKCTSICESSRLTSFHFSQQQRICIWPAAWLWSTP